MFAVIEDGSHQHRVQEGDLLSVDYRSDAEVGAALTFDRVLLANGGGASIIGTPVIDGASVEGEVVLDEEKGPKLEVQKIRRRKNSRRHTGHRQKYTRIKITSISVPNLEVVASSEPAATLRKCVGLRMRSYITICHNNLCNISYSTATIRPPSY